MMMTKMKFRAVIRGLLTGVVLAFGINAGAQTLLWSDEFNGSQLDESTWSYALGDGCDLGICGWGNQELQTYRSENVSVANGKLVITARRETVNGKDFTSARLLTKDKVSVKYGRVEASIKIPDLNNGLWPAFWMLGDGNRWPYTGEIDIMEAGFSATSTNANAVAKANVFWRAEDAGVTGNLQYGNEDAFKYDAPANAGMYLNEAYFVYRVDWTPTSMSTYILQTDASGNPIESTAYQLFSIDNAPTFESEFFSGDHFYILLNMAVGGWLPFTTAENTAANVTALPNAGSEAYMLVDYVRVYSLSGAGAVTLGNVEADVISASGYGVFADGTTVADELAFGVDAELFLWEDAASPAIDLTTVSSPYGTEAYQITFPANQWAGMTLNSSDVLNFSAYENGSLRFKMNTTSQEPFSIGVSSAGGSAGVNFLTGEEKFGLVRDGQWHDVEIPLSLLVTSFEAVYSPFVIGNVENSNPTTSVTMLLDEIYFSSQPASGYTKYVPAIGNYGIYTTSTVADEFTLGTDGDLYIWEQTLVDGATLTYNGQPALNYVHNNKGWFGLGFTADEQIDLSAFETGNLHLAMKSSSTETLNLTINIGLAAGTVVFTSGSDPYGFARDGQWHELTIPLADFDGVSLAGVTTLLSLNGTGNITDIALADIYFEYTGTSVPVLTSLAVTPQTASIAAGASQQFAAQGYDQNGNTMAAQISWSASGGSITSSGLFTSSQAGSFTVTASSGSVQASAAVSVSSVSAGTALPAVLQAEDYEDYEDSTVGNDGGAYRSDDVDLEATSDAGGGYNVGWIDAGEWLEYTVSVSAAGLFDFTARVASPTGAGSMHVEVDGVNVTGTMAAVNTGGWQTFADVVAQQISLSAGNHTLRMVFDAGGFNLNYLSVTASQSVQPVLTTVAVTPQTASITAGASQQFAAQGYDQFGNTITATYTWTASGGTVNTSGLFSASAAGSYTISATSGSVSGTASVTVTQSTASGWSLPGRVEAENFNSGGQGVGYYDTTTGNLGGAFRTSEDVDLENTGDTDGLYNVGWAEAGEWLAYDINSTVASYDLEVRVASATGGGAFRIEIDGQDVTGSVSVANTGGWQLYQTIVLEDVAISAGNHVMKVVFISAGINLNYVTFAEHESSSSAGGCSATAANGDYSVEISADLSNPTLTFVPGYTGVGSSTVILYYGTSPTGTYPGYLVAANTPYQISAAAGQTIYYYYTYSVPEGGERNSSASRHSFTVGDCGGSARVTQVLGTAQAPAEVSIYPNPASNQVTIQPMGSYTSMRIVDMNGRVIRTAAIQGAEVSMSVEALAKGTYIIVLSGPDGTITRKLIKE